MHRQGSYCTFSSIVVVVLGLEDGAGRGVHLVLVFHAAHVELYLVFVAAVVAVELALNAGDVAFGDARIGESGGLGPRPRL